MVWFPQTFVAFPKKERFSLKSRYGPKVAGPFKSVLVKVTFGMRPRVSLNGSFTAEATSGELALFKRFVGSLMMAPYE